MKKKIMVFSGAGLSKESGIETFRDSKDSLWNNFKIEDVATINGWRKNKEVVLDFYNERRKQLKNVLPNKAHILLAKLEENFEVDDSKNSDLIVVNAIMKSGAISIVNPRKNGE